MLSPRLHELLTAYVDGELSARQRKSVQRLLQRSTEARTLYHQLKGDSNILRSLPRRKMPNDLSQTVVDSIIISGLKLPMPAPAPAPPVRLSRWSMVAGTAAAAVFVAVGVGSYLFFAQGPRGGNATNAFHKGPGSAPARARPGASDRPGPGSMAHRPELDAAPAPWPGSPPMPAPIPLGRKAPAMASVSANLSSGQQPIPQTPQYPLATPVPPPAPIIEIPEPPLLLAPLRNLDQPAELARLQGGLQKQTAYRLELFCGDSARSLDRLQAAFKEQGIQLRRSQEVNQRLKQRGKASFALFVEDVTPEELARALQKLGREDKAAAARNPNDGQFGEKPLLIKALSTRDRTELATLMGVDASRLRPASARALSGQAAAGPGTPRPEPTQPATGKAAERTGLVMTYTSPRARSLSREETKQFLQGRKDARPGTVQVFLVLQN